MIEAIDLPAAGRDRVDGNAERLDCRLSGIARPQTGQRDADRVGREAAQEIEQLPLSSAAAELTGDEGKGWPHLSLLSLETRRPGTAPSAWRAVSTRHRLLRTRRRRQPTREAVLPEPD